MFSFYEFFAGGGMARAGLGRGWKCLFANDIDPKKAASYVRNWGDEQMKVEDVGKVAPDDLPGQADLAWASFPCQDLSLAGNGAGLKGARSGTFWPFWSLMKSLIADGRAPAVIVLENVCGALTSHEGKDFASLASALASENYSFGALVVDAAQFLPQSRPRLFIVAVKDGFLIPSGLKRDYPDLSWTSAALRGAYDKLPKDERKDWIWWTMPVPAPRTQMLSDVIEDEPDGVQWHAPAETKRLLGLMSPLNRKKVAMAQKAGKRVVGTIYKRTRPDETGKRAQRAEVRFDEIAGCLRTPVGGSSRQLVMVVNGDTVRTRLLSPREAVRLMGLADDYKLPENYNEAYHIAGDGLAVPVVRHLAAHILEPTLKAARKHRRAAA